jgi:hypothetical protein
MWRSRRSPGRDSPTEQEVGQFLAEVRTQGTVPAFKVRGPRERPFNRADLLVLQVFRLRVEGEDDDGSLVLVELNERTGRHVLSFVVSTRDVENVAKDPAALAWSKGDGLLGFNVPR